ncbi:MAG: ATP-binding cassette domain-containing protein [Longibaculum sp.]
MIELKHIHLSFDDVLIQDGEMIISDEQITVITGKSGSGKSSLLYDIALITKQAQMDYQFYDYDVTTLNAAEKQDLQRNYIAFVFQNIPLFNCLNLMENIKFFAYLSHQEFDENKAREYLTDLHLFLDDSTDIKTLSGGERQRLAIVCALMKDTPLIILDEPTAYLDYDNIQRLIEVLKLLKNKYHKTILIASHDENIKEISDCLYEIKDKKLIQSKCSNNQKHTIYQQKQNTYQKALSLFYCKTIKGNHFKYSLLKILIILLLSFSCFLQVFLQKYQEQLHEKINTLESYQIIVQSHQLISNQELKKMKYYEEIKDIKRFIPIETDNEYLICPYINSDFFQNNKFKQMSKENQIYGNYELYRQEKSTPIHCSLSSYQFPVDIDVYLNQTFEDYRGFSYLSKVIYVPYETYQELLQYTDINIKESNMFIIELKDKAQYLNVLQIIDKDFLQLEVVSNSNLMKMIDVLNKLETFNQLSVIFIMGLFMLGMIILKVFDQYQWRYNEVLLETNGISSQNIRKLLLKKDFYLMKVPWIVSILIVIGIYGVLGLLNKDVAMYICLFITGISIFIYIGSYLIYIFIKLLLSDVKIIKKF